VPGRSHLRTDGGAQLAPSFVVGNDYGGPGWLLTERLGNPLIAVGHPRAFMNPILLLEQPESPLEIAVPKLPYGGFQAFVLLTIDPVELRRLHPHLLQELEDAARFDRGVLAYFRRVRRIVADEQNVVSRLDCFQESAQLGRARERSFIEDEQRPLVIRVGPLQVRLQGLRLDPFLPERIARRACGP
jgi:hypothetical protein